jgi:hypothetical protein
MSGGRERGWHSSKGELTWWRSQILCATHCGGGGRVTLRSTATHPSATPSRATPTSFSVLASENRVHVDLRERDGERSRESERG